MVDTFQKEVQCSLCPDIFQPVIEPAEEESSYLIYCSSCVEYLSIARSNPVRIAFREVLGLKGESLALALQTVLASCQCGGEFSHDAGQRCPKCIYKIEREMRKSGTDQQVEFYCPWNLQE